MKLEVILGLVLVVIFGGLLVFYFFGDMAINNMSLSNSSGFGNFNPKSKVRAHEISSPDGFINTGGEEITIGQYKDKKVVLLDIWTYSCINCQRTLPYLNDWYEKYHDEGLEIIGLHTPEFAFEHKIENVEKAVEEFNIKYPVVLDNDYSTWRAYGNRYWPRKYLIDLDGNIVYDHIGEGGYEETEKVIRRMLGLDDNFESINASGVGDRNVKSPEVYFGAFRNDLLANGETRKEGSGSFTFPDKFVLNRLYLDGDWEITREYAKSRSVASIGFRFSAKNVYMVASADEPITVSIYVDGELEKSLEISDEKLYEIFMGDNYGNHDLMIKIPSAGLEAFTFTFG